MSRIKAQIESMPNEQRCDSLERILRSYCPNDGKSYAAIDKMALDKKTTPKDYVMALADGFMYGNWPWTSYVKPAHLIHTPIELKSFDARADKDGNK